MKRTVFAILVALLVSAGVTFAHGDAEHVRGTVTSVTDTAITVQTTTKQTRVITVSPQTMVMRGDAHLSLKDVKVGDRVVIDVDKKSKMATEVKLGTPATTKPAAKAAAKHKG
jgi:ribosomal protein S1